MVEIHFECPSCAQSINAPQELANQLIECPTCKNTIEVPACSRSTTTPGILVAETQVASETSSPSPRIKAYEYKVVPFVAVITQDKDSATAASQLELLIQSYAKNGWEYVRLENVETYIQGDAGCFGIGATPPRATAYSMVVFKR